VVVIMLSAMRRVGVLAASTALLVGGLVGTAAADPPEIIRYPDFGTEVEWPNDDPDPFWSAERCSFPVRYQDTGKGMEILFADGRYLATAPGLHATVTNVETGASLSLPVNGSMRITWSAPDAQGNYTEVIVFRGPSIDISAGQLTWFTGRRVVVREYNADDEVVAGPFRTQTGRTLDVCAALAG
jgi:hypothetical protein